MYYSFELLEFHFSFAIRGARIHHAIREHLFCIKNNAMRTVTKRRTAYHFGIYEVKKIFWQMPEKIQADTLVCIQQPWYAGTLWSIRWMPEWTLNTKKNGRKRKKQKDVKKKYNELRLKSSPLYIPPMRGRAHKLLLVGRKLSLAIFIATKQQCRNDATCTVFIAPNQENKSGDEKRKRKYETKSECERSNYPHWKLVN